MPLRSRTIVTTIVLFLLCLSIASAADIVCTECGMRVDTTSKFSARITKGDTILYFCDIGDLFVYLRKNSAKDARIEVRDYAGGEAIDARNAFYVHAETKFRTPMGWGIAAFKNKDEAARSGSAMDFDATAKALK